VKPSTINLLTYVPKWSDPKPRILGVHRTGMESIRIKPPQLFVSHEHRKNNQVLSAKDGNGKSDPDDYPIKCPFTGIFQQ
jgi:hypothetical protein